MDWFWRALGPMCIISVPVLICLLTWLTNREMDSGEWKPWVVTDDPERR